jgi:hypothetical protein
MGEKTMTAPGSVLLTNNIYDYALAISAHRQIAAGRGLNNCYPVLLSSEQLQAVQPLLNYYGLTTIDFAGVFNGEDPVQRSQEIQRSLFRGTTRSIFTSSSAPPDQLSRSVMHSLRAGCPLLLVDSSDAGPARVENATPAGRSDHLVVGCSRSQLAVGAAFYAEATDKQFRLVEDLTDIERTLERSELSSVILVDDFLTFTKGFLEQLLHWSLESRHTPVQLGILTAYSPNEFSSLVARMLLHRDFHRNGNRSAEPQGLERLSLKSMKAVEYYIISEHGNEMHMRHGEHEVICGAFSREHKRNGSLAYDCEVNCPYDGRVRSNQIPVHNIIILSCNSLTFGDGLIPPEYTVLLNFLNGWPISAIAPFKHVQLNSGMAILVDSLIRSGFSLGEISQRLNCIGQPGTLPDYAYVLVGDPEVVPGANDRYIHPKISVEKYDSGVEVNCSPDGKYVVECLVPHETISHLIGNGHALTVDPVSAELCKQDVFFTFMPVQKARQLGVLMFSGQKLFDGTLSFRLHHAHRLSDAQKHSALNQMSRIASLSIFGLDETIVQARDSVLKPLRAMVSYPRPLELALGEAAARNFDFLLDDALLQTRRLVIEKILTMLEKSSLWLSHQYGSVYPLQYRLPSESPPARCHTCDSSVYNWRYEDNCTGLSPRTMVLCVRCGIIADTPVPAELEICLPAFNELSGASHEQQIIVRNRSDRQIELSLFAQFNQWKRIGSTVDPLIQELNLEPGETANIEARFIFDGPLPSGIREMQCCALTDRFDLYCATQRGISSQGGAYRDNN